MERRKQHPILSKIIACVIAAGVLLAYILLTNPNNVALPLLLIPFILIGYIVYAVVGLMLHAFTTEQTGLFGTLLPLSAGFIAVALMVLSSLHQLTWKDVGLVLVFTTLLWLYIWRADFLHKK